MEIKSSAGFRGHLKVTKTYIENGLEEVHFDRNNLIVNLGKQSLIKSLYSTNEIDNIYCMTLGIGGCSDSYGLYPKVESPLQTGLNTITTAGSFVSGTPYLIQTLGTTTFSSIGATSVTAGSFVVGATYIIVSVGTTNFTLVGASANTVGVTFCATGVGSGTGTVDQMLFTASGVGSGTGTAALAMTITNSPNIGTVTAGSFNAGTTYIISSIGSTDFTTIGASANTVGLSFVATGIGSGSGTAVVAFPSVTFISTLGSSIGNGLAISEAGLFTCTGNLFACKNFPALTKTSAFSVNFSWSIQAL